MKKFITLLAVITCLLPSLAAEEVELGPGLYARMVTTRGEMLFELDYANTPLTVSSFVGLSENSIDREVRQNTPFFDGLSFYRDIENYAIFSGDPLNNGLGDPGYTMPRETGFANTAGVAGTLVMTGLPGESSGSSFFITKGMGDSYLDELYTPFGRLVEGEKVLNKLRAGDELITVSIERKGPAAEGFIVNNETFMTRYEKARRDELNILEKDVPEVVSVIRNFDSYSKTLSGIYYSVLFEGYGDKPIMGQTATVHYSGSLPDGTTFDSSVERNQPFAIQIGVDSVIPGWLEAILDMKTGEVRTIVIPPELGYGERGIEGVIPADSWLVFSIQLLSIE